MSGEARSREVTACLYTTMLPFTNGDWLPELRKGLSLLWGGGVRGPDIQEPRILMRVGTLVRLRSGVAGTV